MVLEQPVVQDLVTIMQRGKKLVLRQVGRLRAVLLIRALRLLLQRQNAGRKQALQAERHTLLGGEPRAAVVMRIAEQARRASALSMSYACLQQRPTRILLHPCGTESDTGARESRKSLQAPS
jgi:hypothetical protein